MNIDEHDFKHLTKLSLLKYAFLAFIAVSLMIFYIDPVEEGSGMAVISVLCVFYLYVSLSYFLQQRRIWKNISRYRFVSWYYISFKSAEIIVWLVLSILNYFWFDNILLALVAFTLWLNALLELYSAYFVPSHFIHINPEEIFIVKKRILNIYPENITEVHYRNDILIFKLKNERTVFINFLEVQNPKEVRTSIAEWLSKNGFSEYQNIIEELKNAK